MTSKRVWLGAAAVGALLASVAAAGAQTGACTDITNCRTGTDRPASVLVFPKIEVDPADGTDTVIQLTSVSEAPVSVRCSYLNANGHCSDSGEICQTDEECGGARCLAGWSETDFRVTLTRLQPLSWNASVGLSFLPCDLNSPDRAVCIGRNDGRIPPVPEPRFVGELKCIQVDDADAPVDFNELIGEATTIRAAGTALDASKYNAIGLQGIPGANDNDNRLCLGGTVESEICPRAAEYAGCPQTLIMDHFFDGASLGNSGPVSNRIVLVPCSEDLLNAPGTSAPAITVQFLIFNEFEQRTSTSLRFRCFAAQLLSDIDTGPGPFDDSSSIFNVATQGTPVGQTRITGVGSAGRANGVLGLLEAARPCEDGPDGICTSAVNLHQQGRRTLSDVLEIP